MSKVMLKVEVEEDYLKSIKASTNKTSSDIILINATPLTESEDCVSRQEAIMRLTGINLPTDMDKFIALYHQRIKALKPVLPKRKKGEWIDCQDEGYVECPICGSATNCDDNKEDLHYCFSCGAEMR